MQSALARLVTFLKEQGATVLVVDIPHEGDGKTAIDDYLAAGGKLEELERRAHPYSPTDIATERLSRDEKLHAGIQELQRRWRDMPTVRQGECTDQDTAWELIVRAGEIGKVVKDGIRVRVSVRTLALATGISPGGQLVSLRRLEANGFLRQDNKGRRPEQAGAYILLIYWRALGKQYGEKGAPEEKVKSEGDNEIPPGVGECNIGISLARSQVPALRWSQPTITWHKDKHDTRHHEIKPLPRLGKKRAAIIVYLLESGGSATIAELMKRFAGEKTRPRDFRRRTLAMLEGYRYEGGRRYETGPAIVLVEDGIVSLLNNWLEAVEIHRSLAQEIDREEMGVLVKGAATLQAERYERDRARFRNRQKKKTNPEQEMSPPVLWSQRPADERAGQAVRYLAENYPECGGTEVLGPYYDAMHEAAAREVWDGYEDALRNYMRAGRRAALALDPI